MCAREGSDLPLTYTVNVRSRFAFGVTPDSLYDHAYEVLSRLERPWGLRGINKKPLPAVKSNFTTGVSYTREIGRQIRSYALGFNNRDHTKQPPDLPMYDDALLVVIRPKQLTQELTNSLLRDALPAYVEAMHPYWIALEEDALALEDARMKLADGTSVPRPGYVDSRKGVHRIWPANYWDKELCRRAFDLSPAQVVERLSPHVAEARIIEGGVLLVADCEIPADRKSTRLNSSHSQQSRMPSSA